MYEDYEAVMNACRNIFIAKNTDYGTAWRVLRLTTLTDQIMIKVRRIQSIQQKSKQMVNDSIDNDLIGVINYAIIAIMQLHYDDNTPLQLNFDKIIFEYDNVIKSCYELYLKKNHDYDESWKLLRKTSIIDIILMKVFRLINIEKNNGEVTVSEGVESNYQDIINYSVFGLLSDKD